MDVLMRATRGLMREPELAEALIRSLLLSDVKTDFGYRMSELLLRAAYGPPEEIPAGDPRRLASRALSGIWTMEMIEMLRGNATAEEIQARLEITATRLLIDP
ncbi:hypothetical protein [Actinomadura madurae]|uniref:hypothetical protein n=1 Tax=Actinomadura madurae TaxID=1993 RepID=UPI0020D261E8|nr:hypothetical protein [Actinomadura madurae]MCP9970963.1 hypothetical protein [Actinomadura madurae]MCQ0004995.1 hypothetical protein [Actinomadura madurae]